MGRRVHMEIVGGYPFTVNPISAEPTAINGMVFDYGIDENGGLVGRCKGWLLYWRRTDRTPEGITAFIALDPGRKMSDRMPLSPYNITKLVNTELRWASAVMLTRLRLAAPE